MSRPSARLDNLLYRAEKFDDPRAQFRLGRMYLEGDVVDRDVDEARRWLEQAQEKGHEEAAGLLARLRDEELQQWIEETPAALPEEAPVTLPDYAEEPAPPPDVPPVVAPPEGEIHWPGEHSYEPQNEEETQPDEGLLKREFSAGDLWYVLLAIYLGSQAMC